MAGLLPSLVCRSPTDRAHRARRRRLTGTSSTRVSGRTRYFFATRENLILTARLGLMVLACVWSTRRILRAPCLDTNGCESSPVEALAITTGPASHCPETPARSAPRGT